MLTDSTMIVNIKKKKTTHTENVFPLNYTRDILVKRSFLEGFLFMQLHDLFFLAAEASLLLTVVCFLFINFNNLFIKNQALSITPKQQK